MAFPKTLRMPQVWEPVLTGHAELFFLDLSALLLALGRSRRNPEPEEVQSKGLVGVSSEV
jgi:hypothetical protein